MRCWQNEGHFKQFLVGMVMCREIANQIKSSHHDVLVLMLTTKFIYTKQKMAFVYFGFSIFTKVN